MEIPRHRLAPELAISRLVHGLWQIADMERDGRQLDLPTTAAALGPYAEAGFVTFDMADHYGSAEEIVGLYNAGAPPAPVQALTKWVPTPGPTGRKEVVAAVERALERLRTDALDLLQFHAWSYDDPGYLDCLFELDELRRRGLVRHLGLTNFDTDHLRLVLASGIPIVSNQVCYSLLDRRAGGAMTELCRRHGVGLLAYGTLAGGLLSERFLGLDKPPEAATWSQMKYLRFVQAAGGWARFQALLAELSAQARRLGASPANVACRYILDQPAVAAVIVGARLGESEHREDNRRLFQLELDAQARAALDRAAAALEPLPGDCGDEYRRPPFLTASGDLSHHLEELPAPYRPEAADDGRARIDSGTPWEARAGYCRALRQGRRIVVSGTTASHGARLIGGSDAAAQTTFVIDKIEGALRSLGGRLADVVRTRLYVAPGADVEAIARVHGRRFGAARPTNTLVTAGLVGGDFLLEMEAEAMLPEEESP